MKALRWMIRGGGAAALAMLMTSTAGAEIPGRAAPEPRVVQEGPEARVWLDRGVDPVYSRGERARVYYRVSEGSYVAIFHIDTDGRTRLVFPRTPHDDSWVRGGRDYRLLFPKSPYFRVDDHPGVGYFFMVASPDPLDFSAFYQAYDRRWDLTLVGSNVYRDPYLAMDEFVAHLIPDWEYAYYALDFSKYNVDRAYEYPRFMCYECHGYRPYSVWNPYRRHCTSFRVVIHTSPYYYPSYRYRGDRVVFVRPPVNRGPRFVFKERAAGEPGVPLKRAPRRVADPVVDDAPRRRRPSSAGGGTPVRRPRSTPPPSLLGPSRTPDRIVEPSRRPDEARPRGTRSNGAAGSSARPSRRPGGSGSEPTVRPPSRGGSSSGEVRRVRPPKKNEGRERAKKPVLRRRPSGSSGGTAGTPPSSTPRVRPSTSSGSAARPSRSSRSGRLRGSSGRTRATPAPSRPKARAPRTRTAPKTRAAPKTRTAPKARSAPRSKAPSRASPTRKAPTRRPVKKSGGKTRRKKKGNG